MTIKLFEDDNKINLEQMFDEINAEHFDGKIKRIPCVWNMRLRVCAGKCYYKTRTPYKNGAYRPSEKEYTPTRIEMAYKLFEANGWNRDMIYNTLVHEMTHAYLTQEHNEPGHTDRFQQIMTRITGEIKNHRCHQYDVSTLRNKRDVIYWCDCGMTTGKRARMPKTGLVYRSRCCKSVITFQKEGTPIVSKEKAVANNKPKDNGNGSFFPLF